MAPMYKQVWTWKVLPNGDKIKEYAQVRARGLERYFPDEKRRRYGRGGLRWRVRANDQLDANEGSIEWLATITQNLGAKLNSIIQLYRVGERGADDRVSDADLGETGVGFPPKRNIHNTLQGAYKKQ